MSTRPAAFTPTLRSIPRLLRRQTASAVGGMPVVGGPMPVNPTAEDPIHGVANGISFSGRPLDLALFGRFDWPAMIASEQVNMFANKVGYISARNSDDEEYGDGDFASDDFDDEEDDGDYESFDDEDGDGAVDSFDDEDVNDDEDDVAETKSTARKRR